MWKTAILPGNAGGIEVFRALRPVPTIRPLAFCCCPLHPLNGGRSSLGHNKKERAAKALEYQGDNGVEQQALG
jgi:hypothetical protein